MLSKKPLVGVLVLSLAFAGIAGTTALVSSQDAVANVSQGSELSPKVEGDIQTVYNETNKWRTWVGLNALNLNPELSKIAQDWSVEISVRQKQDHNPTYAQQLPAGWLKAGENIGYAWPADELVELGWLQSQSHNKNVYGDFTDMGLGLTYDAKGQPWYVAVYAKYRNVEANPVIQHSERNITPTSASLAWSTPPVIGHVTKYTVEVSDVEGNVVRTQDTKQPSLELTGLNPDTEYRYRVIVEVKSLNGTETATSPSALWAFRTLPAAPTEPEEDLEGYTISADHPSSLKVVPSTTSLAVNWVEGEVYIGTLDKHIVRVWENGNLVKEQEAKGSYALLTGLRDNATYTVNVYSNIISPNGKESRELDAREVTVTTPKALSNNVSSTPVQSMKVTTSDTSMTTTWVAPKTVVGKVSSYKVLVTGPSGYKREATLPASTLSYVATGMKASNVYKVTVTAVAVSESGLKTASSAGAVLSGTTQKSTWNTAATGTPNKFAVSSTYNSAKGSWAYPSGVVGKVTGYTVKLTGPSYSKTYTTTAGSQNFTGLRENTKYTMTVYATAQSASGTKKVNSKVLTKTVTTGFTQASKVSVSAVQKLSKSKITKSSVYVTFSKPKTVVGKITKYTVQVTGKGYNKTYNNMNGKVSFSGLKKNTKYTIKVTAYASSTNGKYKKTAATSTTFWTKK